MHRIRHDVTTRIPIRRKGTKYIAVSRINPDNAVSVIMAVRDMLKLARTAKEVTELRKDQLLKVNSRTVYDIRDAIQLFGVLSVGDKHYRLSILPTNKFFFEETKEHNKRLCKIIGKRLVSGGKVQVSLHDGSTVIGKADMKVNDSLYLDNEQKILKHVKLDSGSQVFIVEGKYAGLQGKVSKVIDGKVTVKMEDKEATLPSSNVIAQ